MSDADGDDRDDAAIVNAGAGEGGYDDGMGGPPDADALPATGGVAGAADEDGGDPYDPVAAAIAALPKTLLQYRDIVVLDGAMPIAGAPAITPALLDGSAAVATLNLSAGSAALARTGAKIETGHPVAPAILQQRSVLSDAPIVTTTDKVLDCVLPPREVVVEVGTDAAGTMITKRVVQPVANKQASRPQLAELQQLFDFKLQDSKARADGICPVRQAIFGMLFDELLRQVTIDCPERGLLLLRIRDQVRLTLDAARALYDSSVQYASRKSHEATKSVPEMTARIKELTSVNTVLRKEVDRLNAKVRAMELAEEERKRAQDEKYREETAFMDATILRLKNHIKDRLETEERKRAQLRAQMDGEEEEPGSPA